MAFTDNGIVIFIRGFPKQVSEDLLRTRMLPYLADVGIQPHEIEVDKPKTKGFATMHVTSTAKGENFLVKMRQFPSTLSLGRHILQFEPHSKQDGGALIRDRKFVDRAVADAYVTDGLAKNMEALTVRDHNQLLPQSKATKREFSVQALNCGSWRYHALGNAIFVSEFNNYQPGKLLVGSRSLVAVFYNQYQSSYLQKRWVLRVDFPWEFIDMIYLQRGHPSSLLVTCKYAPRMYRNTEQDEIFSWLQDMMSKNQRTKARIPCLSTEHSAVVGSCLTWELVLDSDQSINAIQNMLRSVPDAPDCVRVNVEATRAAKPFKECLRLLNLTLTGLHVPFVISFQLLKLALNGHLHPDDLGRTTLAIILEALNKGKSAIHCAEALRQLDRDLAWAGPQTPRTEVDSEAIRSLLGKILDGSLENSATYRAVKKNETLAMIHHIQVTPAGIYLEGPDPEVTNRVLRKYEHHIDSFVRVTFSDEDGEQLQFRFDTSNDEVYDRFQAILDDAIPLCGRSFQFLGFSQSSLRSQTAWFMAPFPISKSGEVLTPDQVIQALGDFSHLRSPAKCAARIGQAFTDTDGFVAIQASAEICWNDIERNGRVFSDGCAVMAADLAYQIAEKYSRFSMKEKPTVFQIRYRGAKGVLSVDPDMADGSLCIRPSMRKFETADTNTHDLEVCGMADKMRPMYLNRNLIKILEDLGVPHENFLQLAQETLSRLQGSTNSFFKAAKLLDDERVGTAAGFPGLLRRMDQIGIDPRKDRMLCAVVEMAAFVRLRAMKYKGRILVKEGVKLMGIMDETAVLNEGEIHIAWIDERGRRVIHTGEVAITRSPTNHPGDVQLVTAVDVQPDSPLRNLHNCVIFSQHGERDLPSQLGGGDLDGDLYDVFWDKRILPRRVVEPAEYPRMDPISLDRPVAASDISKHFIDFMKNDNIGLLANLLLMMSDRTPSGSMDPSCIAISELMSTALDYPKTGIVANMGSLPKFNKSWRPDFMAPGPSVKIEEMSNPFSIVTFEPPEDTPDDPVVALDPEERKVRYYASKYVLGKIYRMIDEKGFYDELQAQTKEFHKGQSILEDVLAYARRAVEPFEFKGYLDVAQEIRNMYEEQVDDISHKFALHSAHPLHEIEVVTGAVLGSLFARRLREITGDMKERYARDVAYFRERIRYDAEGSDEESMPRALACLYIGVKERGRRIGRHGDVRMWSWPYVAASVCLEEIERFNGGRLPAL